MGEEERLKMLEELQKNKKEVTDMLNKMPLSMKTMALQKRKEELEEKLLSIEKNIDIFSRKKVFVAL